MSHEPYTVTLPEWEGPLDLLLHVIRSHELNILDIPIAFVTEQYLKYLEMMKELALDVAAEYLEMAATLAYIKSRMLLPDEPSEDDETPEEEADPRAELVRRLLEYQRYKDAAAKLSDRPMLGRDTFAPAPDPSLAPGEEPLAELGVFDLLEAFRGILERAEVDLSHEVVAERLSVSERIGELVDMLRPGELVPFERLFEDQASRMSVVVTFLAVLEMTKLRMTRLFQAARGGGIYVALTGRSTGSGPEPLQERAKHEGDQWQRARRQRGATRLPRTLKLLRRATSPTSPTGRPRALRQPTIALRSLRRRSWS